MTKNAIIIIIKRHEFIRHVLDAHLIQGLLSHFEIGSITEDPAKGLEMTEEWLEQETSSFIKEVISVPTDATLDEADHINNFHRSFIHDAMLYTDLRNAIRYDDGPRIILYWRWWLLFFEQLDEGITPEKLSI